MSEKPQQLTGPASQYPPDPDDKAPAKSPVSPSPSAAETTQFPKVDDEYYDSAGFDDGVDDSQSGDRSFNTDSFPQVPDDSASMNASQSQPTQYPNYHQEPSMQPQQPVPGYPSQGPYPQQPSYPPGYTPSQYPQQPPQQQFQQPPQGQTAQRNSINPVILAVVVVLAVLLAMCITFLLHTTGVITLPFLASNTSTSAEENQNRVVPDNQGRAAAPQAVSRPVAPVLPAGAVPANASALNNSPGGKFENAYVGSSVTSSEFASEVQKSFFIQYHLTKSTTQTLHVVSPVTGQLYEMNCTDNNQYVTCTGGINAVVYIV